jgi:hypothetical protein
MRKKLSMNFSYILEKIQNTVISEFPFRHLEINELFEPVDFNRIIESAEITLQYSKNDNALFEQLFSKNYRIIGFPGCTLDFNEYIKWHKEKKLSHKINTACEGYGVVLRLIRPVSSAIVELQSLLSSPEFIKCISRKFDIIAEECNYDAGIQKYLDGYEISPHPDIRSKALTYMVNINPNPDSKNEKHHTSYLKFSPAWNYVGEFWRGNKNTDRCWIPWEWCEIKKNQLANNSLVLFSPNNESLHAVKAQYNHLEFQRTQLYGNLWYKGAPELPMPKWEDLVIGENINSYRNRIGTYRKNIMKIIPRSIKNAIKSIRNSSTHTGRRY